MSSEPVAAKQWEREVRYAGIVTAAFAVSFTVLWFVASREYVHALPLGSAVVFCLRLFAVGATALPLLAAFDLIGERQKLRRAEEKEAKEAYEDRRPLREAVRLFYHQQSEYRSLFEKRREDQKQWADSQEAFVEIINDWRLAKAQFDSLRKSDDYRAVLDDLKDEARDLERLWDAREELIGHARFDSSTIDRARRDLRREFEWLDIEDQENRDFQQRMAARDKKNPSKK